MEIKNEQPQAAEVEEQAPVTPETPSEPQDDVITLSKAEYNKLNRKAFAYEATKKTPPQPKEIDPDLRSDVENLKQIEAKRQFGYQNNLSPEETDWIFKVSGGKPTKEIFEDPFVKSGLEGYRQAQRAKNNTPSSSARGFVSQGKDFQEMTEAERRKAFDEARKERLGQ